MSELDTTHISIPGPAGDIRAYSARPRGAERRPALLLAHEILGLVHHIEDVARRLAALGYDVIAPDVYCHDAAFQKIDQRFIVPALLSRNAPNRDAALAAMPEEQRLAIPPIWAWLATRSEDSFVPDLQATTEFLHARPGATGKVGALGFCMGGSLMGGLLAEGAAVNAAVVFYGEVPRLDRVPRIQAAFLGHYAELDVPITSTVPAFVDAMQRNDKEVETHVYPGVRHAFFNNEGPFYHEPSAQLAWERSRAFLARHLQA